MARRNAALGWRDSFGGSGQGEWREVMGFRQESGVCRQASAYMPRSTRRTFVCLTKLVRQRRTQHWYRGCSPGFHGCK